MFTAYIALGSNVGERRKHLDYALTRLGALGTIVEGSPIYETDAVGGPADQPAYLNAVVHLQTDLDPRELLDQMLAIEKERGRVRSVPNGPRTLDMDLLWYDGQQIDEPDLSVPHPRIRERRFVVAPLVDVAPRLTDIDGPYADSLTALEDQNIRRLTGPIHPDGDRWMIGLADAVVLEQDGDVFRGTATPDWSNRSGDTFGGLLASFALSAASIAAPEDRPTQLSYRFLEPVLTGSELELTVDRQRVGRSTMDVSVDIRCGGSLVGSALIATTSSQSKDVTGPPAPRVLPRSEASSFSEIITERRAEVGLSILSWNPLERWDIPDLEAGNEPVFRAWSPNAITGSNDPYLRAASLVMPMDALMWPATMQALGHLPAGAYVSTPTIELVCRFAHLTEDAWHIAEASIDHFAGHTVAGTIRVWGSHGSYAGVGHSVNLVRS